MPDTYVSPPVFHARLATGEAKLRVVEEDDRLTVFGGSRRLLAVDEASRTFRIALSTGVTTTEALEALQAGLEQRFADPDGPAELHLAVADSALRDRLTAEIGAVPDHDGLCTIRAEQFFQNPRPWLPGELHAPYPLRYVFTAGQRHPVRPPKPTGTVYARWVPWLRACFSLRTIAGEEDLAIFHRWMNDPRVDYFWSEAGTLEQHRAYLDALHADPHMLPLFGCVDGRPFCYFELYWARENRLGPYYDAADHDRGWHVVVGEDSCRGRAWVTAWLPSLMHYMFLDDPRTQRIVGEPRADHVGQLKNLDHAGFARIKHVVLPHKRAVLVRLERERFFADRLWAPPQA